MTETTNSKAIIEDRQIKNIFILRPDNLGDMVLFSGTLRHIKERFPGAHIVLCVKNYVQNLLEHCPYVDEIIAWEKLIYPIPDWLLKMKGGWRVEYFMRKFHLARLSNWKYKTDLFLLPVRSATAEMYQFAALYSAKYKIGIHNGDNAAADSASIFTPGMAMHAPEAFDHEMQVHLDFLRFLGINTHEEHIWPPIWTDSRDSDWARNNIPQKNNTVLLGIAPGVTSNSDKFYKASNYAKIISGLHSTTFTVVLFGSKSEREQCNRVEEALAGCRNVEKLVNLASKSTIRQLAEGLRKCDIVLSNETGALHMATALKVPTVGITGGGHFGRFYPWGDPHINLTANKPMDCYYCNWNCIYPSIRCIHEIKPEIVAEKLSRLLGSHV